MKILKENMLSKFICNENGQLFEIQDYKLPDCDNIVRCPALINYNQFVVMQMSSVDSSVGDDLDMMTLCTGSLETEILPLLTSSVFATEVCIMFYIEKIGKQVVYRSRNCPLVLPKYTKYNKCHNCQELLDYLSHLHEQIKEIDESSIKEEGLTSPMEYDDGWDENGPNDENDDNKDCLNKCEVKIEDKPNHVINLSMKSKKRMKKKKIKRKKTLQCPYCEEKLLSEKFRWDHVNQQHSDKLEEYGEGKEIHLCPAEGCDERFLFHKSLTKHALNTHSITIPAIEKKLTKNVSIKEKVSCQFCGKAVNSKYYLKLHLQKCQNPSVPYQFLCPQEGCGIKFIRKKDLKKHAVEVHDIDLPSTDVKCPFCDEQFGPNTNITNHLEAFHITERDNKVYIDFYSKHQKTDVCQECGKVFTNKPAFNVHMRESHPESIGSERCHICGKGYKNKWTLKEHLKRHEKCESLCIECGKTLPNKISLESHIKLNHPTEQFNCPECFRFFKSKAFLRKHIRNIHLDRRSHPCTMCEKSFKDKKTLLKHTIAIHDKVKPFLCELCNFESARIDNLNLHRRKSHGAENMSKTKLKEMVENGEHPYYDKEKIQLLLKC